VVEVVGSGRILMSFQERERVGKSNKEVKVDTTQRKRQPPSLKLATDGEKILMVRYDLFFGPLLPPLSPRPSPLTILPFLQQDDSSPEGDRETCGTSISKN